MSELYTESMFMDSGAFSLYNIHVRKVGRDAAVEEHDPKYLEALKRRQGIDKPHPPIHRRGHGDFSFFNLKPGSEFRKYCDRYADFIKRMQKIDTRNGMFF